MEITWLGHSCFRLKGKQATVITDPFSPEIGDTLGKVSAQIVTVSHPHPGHCYVEGVGDEPRVLKGPGEYEVAGVLTTGIRTFHDEERGAQRGKNTAYVLDIDSVLICHLGDLGHQLSDKQVADLGKIDILLIPVGGFFTIDARVATEVCEQVKPKVIIPMHYNNEKCSLPIGSVDEFLKGKNNVSLLDTSEVEFKAGELPDTTQIIVLKPTL